jgi:hypothetical protein
MILEKQLIHVLKAGDVFYCAWWSLLFAGLFWVLLKIERNTSSRA